MKYRRTQRQYEEMSARFTYITGSVGFAALHGCTETMKSVVGALERAADDPYADLEPLVGHLERMIACTDAIDQYLGEVRNSRIRFCNAFEELAPTCPPPRARVRLDPGSSSRWSRRAHEVPAGPWLPEAPGAEPVVEDP
ncbi:MAG TPA: hypothetical protein PK069_07410 [Methanolinea sp.]|nr:hypothetical protein [Methanolinea sp.]